MIAVIYPTYHPTPKEVLSGMYGYVYSKEVQNRKAKGPTTKGFQKHTESVTPVNIEHMLMMGQRIKRTDVHPKLAVVSWILRWAKREGLTKVTLMDAKVAKFYIKKCMPNYKMLDWGENAYDWIENYPEHFLLMLRKNKLKSFVHKPSGTFTTKSGLLQTPSINFTIVNGLTTFFKDNMYGVTTRKFEPLFTIAKARKYKQFWTLKISPNAEELFEIFGMDCIVDDRILESGFIEATKRPLMLDVDGKLHGISSKLKRLETHPEEFTEVPIAKNILNIKGLLSVTRGAGNLRLLLHRKRTVSNLVLEFKNKEDTFIMTSRFGSLLHDMMAQFRKLP